MQKKSHAIVEGIVLKAVPYSDRTTILSLFTKELGVCSCTIHGASGKNLLKRQLASPLCHAEYVLKTGRGMDTVVDGTIFSLQLHLRSSYAHLESAGKMATIIFKTQMEHKPSPSLFSLLSLFLCKLPEHDPKSLLICFLTKFLIHEGAFSMAHPECTLTREEWAQVETLSSLRSFAALPVIKNSRELLSKLHNWITNHSQK